jgi:hypothetical protein
MSKCMQGMSKNKLIATVSLAVIVITMIASTSTADLVYSTSTTEDDGYTYPDDASDEEKEDIDEQEQEAWEDAGRPGERDDDDDDEGNDDDDDNDDNTPVIANTPTLAVQNTAVNETRWYNNCEGGGKQAGGFLHFDIFAYENCESHANGDKAYYDGFVEGCMGIDSTNTQELCEAFIVGCLRATSIDSSETCRVAVETSSSAWKLVMTKPDGL